MFLKTLVIRDVRVKMGGLEFKRVRRGGVITGLDSPAHLLGITEQC